MQPLLNPSNKDLEEDMRRIERGEDHIYPLRLIRKAFNERLKKVIYIEARKAYAQRPESKIKIREYSIKHYYKYHLRNLLKARERNKRRLKQRETFINSNTQIKQRVRK